MPENTDDDSTETESLGTAEVTLRLDGADFSAAVDAYRQEIDERDAESLGTFLLDRCDLRPTRIIAENPNGNVEVAPADDDTDEQEITIGTDWM